jgi:hypothetical protein
MKFDTHHIGATPVAVLKLKYDKYCRICADAAYFYIHFFILLMAWNLLSFRVEFLILLKPVRVQDLSLTAAPISIRIF